ncbi:hypothetical protein [Pseudoclavibacter sp. JSM 162008]|uniref:hypothetical protein n=1 Tax=Pseudoclavibacter sp. JSM 162008 TaxID=3229855 RepID=UPI0035241603
MSAALTAADGQLRVVAIGRQNYVTRSRAAEFRHLGMALVHYSAFVDALLDLAQHAAHAVVLSSEHADVGPDEGATLVRSLTEAPLFLAVSPRARPGVTTARARHSRTYAIPAPVSAATLRVALGELPEPHFVERLQLGELLLEVDVARAHWHGHDLALVGREFDLLHCLARAYPVTPSFAELAIAVGGTRNVRAIATRLRLRITDSAPGTPDLLDPRSGGVPRLSPTLSDSATPTSE